MSLNFREASKIPTATQKAREVGLLTKGVKIWHAGHFYDFFSQRNLHRMMRVKAKLWV